MELKKINDRGDYRYDFSPTVKIKFEELTMEIGQEIDELQVFVPMRLIRYWLGHPEGGLYSKRMPHIDVEDCDVWKHRFYMTDDDEWVCWFLWWLGKHLPLMEKKSTIIYRATHVYWLLHDLLHVEYDVSKKGAETITVETEYKRHQQAYGICCLYDIPISEQYLEQVSKLFQKHFDYPIKYGEVSLNPIS